MNCKHCGERLTDVDTEACRLIAGEKLPLHYETGGTEDECEVIQLRSKLDAAYEAASNLRGQIKAADEAWHEQEDELQALRSRLDECRESCSRAVAARDVATSRLDECRQALLQVKYAAHTHMAVAVAENTLAALFPVVETSGR